MNKWYYEKNTAFLESPLNKTFEEILWMSTDEFRQWVIDLRKEVTRLWDEEGQPPRVGFNKKEMAEQFLALKEFHPKTLLKVDELTSQQNALHNTFVLGNAVNQFFPTMMKTRINYTKDVNAGKSIYDHFTDPSLLEKFITYATRHFKRDSFYSHSTPVRVNEVVKGSTLPECATGIEWIREFEQNHRLRGEWDYWLCGKDEEDNYTGYNDELRSKVNLRISKDEIEELGWIIPTLCKTNVDYDKAQSFTIRAFKKGQKLFPIGLKAFRVSFCQYAVNFPSTIARYVYEEYTKDWLDDEKIYVWDPSCGWGGRLMGALTVDSKYPLVYLGNDPNTDHNTTPGRTKYHEIVDFYQKSLPFSFDEMMYGHKGTEFHFWQKGSEDMQHDPEFQKYKGKLSLVFTSPPYFAKEAYSEDTEQSYKRFSQYDVWRDMFLRETLKTAAFWLRPGGYLAWNIADVVFSGETLPLEEDSKKILEEFGMEYVDTLKMTLAQTPGGNRIDENGKPKFKNSCKIDGLWRKYEPIFIFRKPK